MGVSVRSSRKAICGWPTDVVSIAHHQRGTAIASPAPFHTAIVFVPGNPGVIAWYTDWLTQIVERLGDGYSAHGASYAGHGSGRDVVGSCADQRQSYDAEILKNSPSGGKEKENRDMKISWTMAGQIKHKIAFVDSVLEEERNRDSTPPRPMKLVFITHSIGAKFVTACLLSRPDLYSMTTRIIHCLPFIRFDPPPAKKFLLSTVARFYKVSIETATTLVGMLLSIAKPEWIDNILLDKIAGIESAEARKVALDVFTNPDMVRNHLVLGLEEIRGECIIDDVYQGPVTMHLFICFCYLELPESPNDVALR